MLDVLPKARLRTLRNELQAAYDAWHAEREVDVSKIPTLEQA